MQIRLDLVLGRGGREGKEKRDLHTLSLIIRAPAFRMTLCECIDPLAFSFDSHELLACRYPQPAMMIL